MRYEVFLFPGHVVARSQHTGTASPVVASRPLPERWLASDSDATLKEAAKQISACLVDGGLDRSGRCVTVMLPPLVIHESIVERDGHKPPVVMDRLSDHRQLHQCLLELPAHNDVSRYYVGRYLKRDMQRLHRLMDCAGLRDVRMVSLSIGLSANAPPGKALALYQQGDRLLKLVLVNDGLPWALRMLPISQVEALPEIVRSVAGGEIGPLPVVIPPVGHNPGQLTDALAVLKDHGHYLVDTMDHLRVRTNHNLNVRARASRGAVAALAVVVTLELIAIYRWSTQASNRIEAIRHESRRCAYLLSSLKNNGAVSGAEGNPGPSATTSSRIQIGLDWAAVVGHLRQRAVGIDLRSMRLAPTRTANSAGDGVTLAVQGNARVADLIQFERAVLTYPVVSSRIKSVGFMGELCPFELVIRWRP